MLGKRGRRPSFRRTTSMTGFEIDVGVGVAEAPPHASPASGSIGYEYDHILSPRYLRKSSRSDMETAEFLRSCGLCSRRLAAGRDIYMYRGDTAFCSLECREKHMKQDERKERCAAIAASLAATTVEKSSDSQHSEAETVAAA